MWRALSFIFTLASPVVAVEADPPMSRPMARAPTPHEAWEQSPKKADIRAFMLRVEKGEITFEEGVREYRRKWNIPLNWQPDLSRLPPPNYSTQGRND